MKPHDFTDRDFTRENAEKTEIFNAETTETAEKKTIFSFLPPRTPRTLRLIIIVTSMHSAMKNLCQSCGYKLKMMRKKLFVLSLLLPILIFGKSYFYPQIKTEIYFASDGSARVRQERTYHFDGSFSWAFVDLKKQGAENIVLNQISEQTDTGWAVLQPEITDSPKSLYVRWNYSAQDETKTFLLEYTIIGAVKCYQDVAEFYWKVIENEHEQINNNVIELFLPEPSPDLFKVYIHSRAKPGMLVFNDKKDNAIIQQSNIPENSFVEVRMLTSPLIFTNVSARLENRYEKILQQEKQNFVVSSLRKFILIPLGLLLIIIYPIILLLTFYYRYGREPEIPYSATYEHEPPRLAPPVVVPAIMSQKPEKTTIYQTTFRGMFATLLDLCTKGIISVQEIKDNHKSYYQFNLDKPDRVAGLDILSRQVVDFFFRDVAGDQNMLTDKAIKEFGTNHPKEFQSFLQGLFDQARDWWQKELNTALLDPKSSKAYNVYILYLLPAVILGPLMLGNGLGALFTIPNPVTFILPFILAIIFFIIFIFLGRSILRWSAPAYQEQKRWLNFRKFIIDFSAIEQAPITLLPIWEHFFVYAVVLGVAQKFLKNITNLATKQGTPLVLPIWYIPITTKPVGLASFAESMGHFESFTSNFTGMMNSFSTSAAVGGGFSGGGGGGGGGGASGAG